MDDLELLRKWTQQQEADEQQAFKKARAEAEKHGKEPFDFSKLREIYDVAGPIAYKMHDEEHTRRRLEVRYYLDYPEVRTLREFAEALEIYDSTR